MTMFCLYGMPAIEVAALANRLPEVLTGLVYRPAHSLASARRRLGSEGLTVRLRGDLRCLLEDIRKESIPVEGFDAIAELDKLGAKHLSAATALRGALL